MSKTDIIPDSLTTSISEVPKCALCNQEILTDFIIFRGKWYHPNHFLCHECKKPLKEDEYKVFANRPYCGDCHKIIDPPICQFCRKPVFGEVINALGYDWHPQHYNPTSLRCVKCGKTIKGAFGTIDGKPICADCNNSRKSETKLLYWCPSREKCD